MLQDSNVPLLKEMTDPSSKYLKNLAQFRFRLIYANTINDTLVPYWTSSILLCEEDEQVVKMTSSDYPSIVKVTRVGDVKVYPPFVTTKSTYNGNLDRIQRNSQSMRMIFFLVFPVLILPISLVTLTLCSIFSRIRFYLWRRDLVLSSKRTFSPTEPVDERECILEMAAALDQIGWLKMSVRTAHVRSHAAIISRSPWFTGSEDVIEHFLDCVLFE